MMLGRILGRGAGATRRSGAGRGRRRPV